MGTRYFQKVSSQNKVVGFLLIFHLPYSKCRGVKICFYSCHYQNQKFFTRVALVSFVQHSCRIRVSRVSLVLHSCRLCRIRVARVALVSLSCRSRVWRSCCMLDQIVYKIVENSNLHKPILSEIIKLHKNNDICSSFRKFSEKCSCKNDLKQLKHCQ